MRIAVLEPFPRTCGVTKWAFELAPGFRRLGHHCDVLSFTKSGNPFATIARDGGMRKGWRWWMVEPDVVRRWDDAPDVLDTYDFIILNEPKNNPQDEEAKKAGSGMWPDYVWALHATKTPWLTVFHDASAYKPKNTPFMADCLSAKSFTGTALQLRNGAYEAAKYAAAPYITRLLDWPWLPYTPQNRMHLRPVTRGIALGGRVLSTKGFASLYAVGHDIPDGYYIDTFGAESGGMGPCPSMVMYEALVKHHDWVGHRGDPEFEYPNRSENSIAINNYGATNMVAPWILRDANGKAMRYTGPYMTGPFRWTESSIAVQLSTDQLVSTFEYTTLEAMDAGMALVLPRYYERDMLGATYNVNWLQRYRLGTGVTLSRGIQWRDKSEAEELVEVLKHTCDLVDADGHDPTINWNALKKYHDPQHLADFILQNVV